MTNGGKRGFQRLHKMMYFALECFESSPNALEFGSPLKFLIHENAIIFNNLKTRGCFL